MPLSWRHLKETSFTFIPALMCSSIHLPSQHLLRGGRCFRKHPWQIADDTNHLLPPAVQTGCDVITVGQVSKWCLFCWLASAWTRCSVCFSELPGTLQRVAFLFFFFGHPGMPSITVHNSCHLEIHLDDKNGGISFTLSISLFLSVTHTHKISSSKSLLCTQLHFSLTFFVPVTSQVWNLQI